MSQDSYNSDNKKNQLRLYVTRTWGDRTLPISSAQWRQLRQKIMNRDNWTCRFCGIRSEKYMVCDHIDGNASNNDPTNLGVNCPTCDKIRHCGLAGSTGQLILLWSDLSQVEIVQKTHQFYRINRRVPKPDEVDPKAYPIVHWTKPDEYLHLTDYANLMMEWNMDQLPNDCKTHYKGFLSPTTSIKHIVIPAFSQLSHALEKDIGHEKDQY